MQCARALEAELSEQQFNTWIRPLQLVEDGPLLKLLAPNRFVVDWVKVHSLEQIRAWWRHHVEGGPEIQVEVGSRPAVRREAAAPAGVEPEVRPHDDRRPAQRQRSHSTASSRARATSSLARPHSRSRRTPAARTTRCSSTAAWVSARRT
jgi:chromosomal replication initiator protein